MRVTTNEVLVYARNSYSMSVVNEFSAKPLRNSRSDGTGMRTLLPCHIALAIRVTADFTHF